MADADRALTETLGRFGLDAVTSQPNLCRNTLRDKLPDQPRQSALLVTALEAGVPSRLVRESGVSDVDTVTARLASGLEQSHGLSPENARWAVETWASALKLADPETPAPRGAVNSLEAGTVIRTPPADEPPPPQPRGDATVTPAPPGDVTAPPTPPADVTAAPTPRADVTAPPTTPGEGTVLRSTPEAGATPPPPPPGAPTPPSSNGPRPRRRQLAVIVGALVLVGVIVAVLVVVLGGSKDSPHRAAGSKSSTSSTKAAAPSSKPASQSASASATSSTAKVTTAFASISPVLAHRGDHEGYPQETMPAFLQAAQRGYTIETDVRWTKDGVPVITHDTKTGLGMVCQGGPYEVARTAWSVLHSRCRTDPSASKTHKAYGIPTFDSTVEQVSRVPGSTLFAEIKINQTHAQNVQFLAILRKWKMTSRTVVTSFFSPYLANFSKEAAAEHVPIRTLRFAAATAPTTLADLQRTRVWGAVFLENWDKIPALMASAHRAGIQVGLATSPDGPTGWAQAKRLGTDFCLTDHPVAYRAWLKQH